MKNVDGDDSREGRGSIRLSRHGMRRSCDACGRKKKRCDGEQPCSRCVRAPSECHYSKRRWHYPHQPQHRQQRHLKDGDGDDMRAREGETPSTHSAVLQQRLLPMKRCRLRASPATGLVGMQENAFLSYFFGCVGFLSLTEESQIRETMVKIMAPATPRRESARGTDCFVEEEHFDALGFGNTFINVLGMKQLPKDPALCTFWCVIAVGALAKGSPIESVERYSELAKEALAVSRSGSTGADLAKASVSLAYLHSFRGDRAKFQECLQLSQSFLRASEDQESADLRVGIPDLIQRCRLIGNEAMPSPGSNEEAPPQLSEVLTEGDLCRFVTESFRVFHQAAYTKAQQRYAGSLDHFYPGGPPDESCNYNDLPPWEVSEAMVEVLRTRGPLDFEPLQGTVDRPSIRAGIGSVLINGALVFEKAAKGDLHGTLERSSRSLEVYERYPGFSRCMFGSHMSHLVLTTLAAIHDPRAREMYERLRGAYNSCRVSHVVAVPPLAEWQGVEAICSHLHCRAVGILVTSEYTKAFTPRLVSAVHESAGLTEVAIKPPGVPKGDAFPELSGRGGGVDPVPGSPRSSWAKPSAMSKSKHVQDPTGAVCPALVTLAPVGSPRSQADKRNGSDNDVTGVSPDGPAPVPRLARGGRRHQDMAEQERDEIAAVDWLEASYAMIDATHTP